MQASDGKIKALTISSHVGWRQGGKPKRTVGSHHRKQVIKCNLDQAYDKQIDHAHLYT